ncbi:hypothetical protein QUF74_02840 [Candidatus Halobeggiatoa sp. HSG11]|nr:hypothetical protein [Candidatus Halobeggiatoa sp. HSG11]
MKYILGKPYAIDGSHEEIVRHFIRNANQNGQYVTLSNISELIQNRESIDIHKDTFV